jgi:hypothetical protein
LAGDQNAQGIDNSPARTTKTLAQTYWHVLDEQIGFDETTHVYTVNGCKAKYSVTGAISFFFEKFNAEKVVLGMMGKPDWPRPEYKVRPVYLVILLKQLILFGRKKMVLPWGCKKFLINGRKSALKHEQMVIKCTLLLKTRLTLNQKMYQ